MAATGDLHRVFLNRNEDGTFLAASIDSPRFCVHGVNEAEAIAKAERALGYFDSVKDRQRIIAPRETRVISPAFVEREVCVAA